MTCLHWEMPRACRQDPASQFPPSIRRGWLPAVRPAERQQRMKSTRHGPRAHEDELPAGCLSASCAEQRQLGSPRATEEDFLFVWQSRERAAGRGCWLLRADILVP